MSIPEIKPPALTIRWVPMPKLDPGKGGTWWQVYRGLRQLGHVSKRVRFGWLASHIEPSGRRLERPFATLREAAWWATFGCEVEVTK